jgi:hypothetical protein
VEHSQLHQNSDNRKVEKKMMMKKKTRLDLEEYDHSKQGLPLPPPSRSSPQLQSIAVLVAFAVDLVSGMLL